MRYQFVFPESFHGHCHPFTWKRGQRWLEWGPVNNCNHGNRMAKQKPKKSPERWANWKASLWLMKPSLSQSVRSNKDLRLEKSQPLLPENYWGHGIWIGISLKSPQNTVPGSKKPSTSEDKWVRIPVPKPKFLAPGWTTQNLNRWGSNKSRNIKDLPCCHEIYELTSYRDSTDLSGATSMRGWRSCKNVSSKQKKHLAICHKFAEII